MSIKPTLGRKYYDWHYENRDIVVPADIADWWLSHLSTTLTEIEKALEGEKIKVGDLDTPGTKMDKTIHNHTLDTALTIIREAKKSYEIK